MARKEDRNKLLSAKSMGALDPLFERVEKRIGELSIPINPEEVRSWHDSRCFNDGGLSEMIDLLLWLKQRTEPSPDGAENTEE